MSQAVREGERRLADGRSAVVYVEGARDRDILEGWAQSASMDLARRLREVTVILGGRQPDRALAHVRALREREPDLAALCVLDGDGLQDAAAREADGLDGQVEIFTWSRRHIESYLLVPGAISRSLGLRRDDPRLSRLVREHLPHPDDEAGYRVLDAKRLLAPRGPFARGLGRPLSLGRIARATPPAERHHDVAALLVRLAALLGPTRHELQVAALRRL